MEEKKAGKAIVIRKIGSEKYFFYQEKKEPRRFRTAYPIKADIPGGAVESGETLQQAVLREVKEETGMITRYVKEISSWLFERPEKNDILVGTTHLCEYVSGEPALSEELKTGYWRKISDKSGLPQWILDDLKAILL